MGTHDRNPVFHKFAFCLKNTKQIMQHIMITVLLYCRKTHHISPIMGTGKMYNQGSRTLRKKILKYVPLKNASLSLKYVPLKTPHCLKHYKMSVLMLGDVLNIKTGFLKLINIFTLKVSADMLTKFFLKKKDHFEVNQDIQFLL